MTDEATRDGGNHLQDLAVSDRGFVFDPFSGLTYSLNGSGLSILRGLKEGLAMTDLIAALRSDFDVPDGADLERDVVEFVGLMRSQGLLPKDFQLT